jgi:hypothetical protein
MATPTALTDFMDFLDDDGFDTPPVPGLKTEVIDGKTVRTPTPPKVYHVPSPDGIDGAKMAALSTLAVKANAKVEVTERDLARLKMDDGEEREMMEMALGYAYGQMMADGVSWERIYRLGQYAFIYFTQGPKMAEDAARAGVFLGKARPTNREERRATGRGQTTAKGSTATRSPRKPRG